MPEIPRWDDLKVDEAFIALHPFLVIPDRSPRKDPCGPFTVTPAGKILGQAPDYVRKNPASARRPLSESERQRRLAIGELTKTAAVHVRWEEIRSGCYFGQLAQIQRALSSIIADQEVPFGDGNGLSILTDYCDRKDIFFPVEGFIPPSMENAIGLLMERAGYSEFAVLDEFDILQTRATAAGLLAPKSLALNVPLTIRGIIATGRYSTPDGRFQCRAAEGSFFTVVKTDRAEIRDVISETLDGFWCDDAQSGSWWLPAVRAVH